MSIDHLSNAIQKLGLDRKVNLAMQQAMIQEISIDGIAQDGGEITSLARMGFMYEVRGIAQCSQSFSDSNGKTKVSFASALDCWGAIASKQFNDNQEVRFGGYNSAINAEQSLALRIAVAGLASENSAETRLRLRRFDLALVVEGNWLDRVAANVTLAFVGLTRKDNGWTDITNALHAIDQLRNDQEEHEAKYFLDPIVIEESTKAGLKLVGFYHLAQMVTTVGNYLQTGQDGKTQVNGRLDTGHRKAVESFNMGQESGYRHLADLVWIGCRALVQNALWSHLEGTSEQLRDFGSALVSAQSAQPVLELWPSQQEALRKNLLDAYQRAILVEMPTSAGKTLLAKFAIAQTKALNPNGIVAYIVPTRALVNQVTLDLRRDFRALKYNVEFAVPAYELDPSEAILLDEAIDILVTTPEKLDLLIRSNHKCVSEIALVVADEAHNLQDEGRGARLELLLGTIKRERRNCRFLLLSPFLPNGEELVRWLGDDRHLPPIQVHWRPSRRLVAAVAATGKASMRRLSLEALPAADNIDFRAGTIIPIAGREHVPRNLTISNLSEATAKTLRCRGGVLILCRGKGTASKRAVQLANDLPKKLEHSDLSQAVYEYLVTEAGYETSLAKCIRKGVAYHHAGMSQEARWLIERLISTGDVDIICGTTTLAQGVNFPISSVIVETLKKGDVELTYSDFWNIAGRAGRALVDKVGIIAFPSNSSVAKEKYKNFLKGEAKAISSQLAALVISANEIGDLFNLAKLRLYPQLSSLLQFLAHAVRVAEGGNVADEIELLLRSSLVYHQTKGQVRKLDSFVKLCRSYVTQVSAQKGLLGLADTTGFATPSVFYLLAQVNGEPSLKSLKEWLPSSLFGNDTTALQKRLKLIAGVPEMKLSDGSGGPLDVERTALILRDWVGGHSLLSLSKKYSLLSDDPTKDDDAKVAEFSQYLFSTLITNASWGMGALEGLCLSDQTRTEESAADHVPSMIYFGVSSTEAVWLRMVGLPRLVAENAAAMFRDQKASQPKSYSDLRKWVSDISIAEWERILPPRSVITSRSMKLIWSELSGTQ